MQTLWTFDTTRFSVRLVAEYDPDADLSWRDKRQKRYDKKHGVEYYCFSVIVECDGREIARDVLGGSGYSDPADFAREHRDPNPLNRNCTIMRKRKGSNVVICHYFPDMVATAIGEARKALGQCAPHARDRLSTPQQYSTS